MEVMFTKKEVMVWKLFPGINWKISYPVCLLWKDELQAVLKAPQLNGGVECLRDRNGSPQSERVVKLWRAARQRSARPPHELNTLAGEDYSG